ncbi:gfo/Idh/MocA family oxidoreductase [bacterium]|nr:gfo/Idh/MocA family oxidoreductase [bacterium]
MKQVKVGVIGVGRMGRRHCRVYSTLRNAQLVGVSDANVNGGRQVAAEYEVPFFRNVEDLLDNVDAVSLAAPTPLHFELAMRCIEHGVHVIIEKPIAATLAEATALTEAAERSGLVVQIGHIERFNPVFVELQHVLEEIKPVAVNMRRLSPYEGSNTDVDVVLDLMIHDIDLALALGGRVPTAVNAYGLTAFSGMIDHAVVQLEFGGGPLISMTASRITEQKVRALEITALEAYLEGDLMDKSIAVHRRTTAEYQAHNHRGVKYRQESVVERIYVPMVEPLAQELTHFTDCIIKGERCLVPARDGLKALQLAEEIRTLIESHMVDATPKAAAMTPAPLEAVFAD